MIPVEFGEKHPILEICIHLGNNIKYLTNDGVNVSWGTTCIALRIYRTVLNGNSAYLKLLNKAKCIKENEVPGKTKTRVGEYMLHIIDMINKSMNVWRCVLSDQSEITSEDIKTSYAVYHIIKYGNTWYEKNGYIDKTQALKNIKNVIENITIRRILDFCYKLIKFFKSHYDNVKNANIKDKDDILKSIHDILNIVGIIKELSKNNNAKFVIIMRKMIKTDFKKYCYIINLLSGDEISIFSLLISGKDNIFGTLSFVRNGIDMVKYYE